jgi:hypothetical protein
LRLFSFRIAFRFCDAFLEVNRQPKQRQTFFDQKYGWEENMQKYGWEENMENSYHHVPISPLWDLIRKNKVCTKRRIFV